MMTVCNGRLGNIMMAYATLYYFNQRYGFNGYLNELQANTLHKIFKPPSMNIKKGEIVDASLRFEDVHELDGTGRYHYDEMVADVEKYKYNRLLNVGQYPLGFQLFEEVWPDLIQQFQFQDDVKESAETALFQSSEKARELYGGKELVFVALHCRRGDYVNHFMTKEYYDDEMLWVRYFVYCIKTYRIMLDTDTTKSVFVMLSDDVPWLRKHFESEPDSVFPDNLAPLQGDRMPGRDMAIFSLCAHLIKNVGTYGVWGGFFVNGTIMYPRTGNPKMEDEGIVGALKNPRWIPVQINQFQKYINT